MIGFNDFAQEYTEINDEVNLAINKVMQKGMFILGEEVEKFETDFSQYIGTKFGVGVNSGSDALLLAVKALGIGKGDEVITVSHTFVSTVDAIVRNEAKPVFVDINPDTFCIDVSKIEEKITKNTKAIIPVHIYGHPVDMDPVLEIAKKYKLFVIEDACQAHGAEYKDKKVGGIGDIGCFSFYPTKNLGAYGDGGMLVTNNEEVAGKLKMLRNYGQPKKYFHNVVGINSRLDELQAAILRVKLKYLDTWNDRRREIACLYNHLLSRANVITTVEKDYARHVYHLYVIRNEKRDVLLDVLQKKGVQSQIHYPVPVHKQKTYLDLGFKTYLPITEKICDEIISLPMNPWLSTENVKFICEEIINGNC